MHRYQVYGLSLQAEFPFPELALDPGTRARDMAGAPEAGPRPDEVLPPPDLQIRRGTVSLPRGPTPEPSTDSWLQRIDDDTVCQFEEIGRFRISGGSSIICDPLADCDPALLRHVILGPVLAQALWQRSLFTLHASVLRLGTRYVAFVGESGAGKSTTAVALHGAGHTLVCDDVAALDWEGSPVTVRPAFARIRAHADTLTSMGERTELLTPVHASLDKWYLPARQFVGSASVPLARIYVLSGGPELGLEPLSQGAALLQLLRHTYYGEQFARLHGPARHMTMAGRLAREIPLWRLTRPRDFARLPEVVRLLQDHTAD